MTVSCGGAMLDGVVEPGVFVVRVEPTIVEVGALTVPSWWPPGMRLKSGLGKGIAGCPSSAFFMYAPQISAG
jgi:hypothetical protein